jgi:hypothetical protein
MRKWNVAGIVAALVVVGSALGSQATLSGQAQQAPPQPMGFFITSVGSGDGGNLGGLAGADKHCQDLAAAAGQPPVNARDRIGNGPWYNAKGVLIAANVADLHGDNQRDSNNIRKPTALNEKGAEVLGVGDKPNQHDILTGSDSHGRIPIGAANVLTCNNWTSNLDSDRAIVGHHDRLGGANASWNAVHSSAGCSQPALVKTGGNGYFYCFAAQ